MAGLFRLVGRLPRAGTRRLRVFNRYALIATLLVFGAASQAQAQVAFENTAETSSTTAAKTVTITAFNPSPSFHSNLVLVVGFTFSGPPGTLTVNYGAQPLALVPGTAGANTANTAYTELWYVANPSLTPGNIVASWTASQTYAMGAVSFSGADQTTPVQNGLVVTGTSATASVTIPSAVGDMTMDTTGNNATTLSTPTRTQRWLDNTATPNSGGSTAAGASPSVIHAWTLSSSISWVSSGVDIKAAAIIAPRTGLYKVGSFTKSIGAAPAAQTIPHGLGVTPVAIILWTEGETTEAVFKPSYLQSFGFSDGTRSGSAANSSENGTTGTNSTASARRMAMKVLTIVRWDQTTLAEADMASTPWDGTNFYLNWTTNNATAYEIHFMAIGGPDVSAKVLNWQTAIATGNQSITGTGFQPTVVIHAYAGSTFLNALPSVYASAAVGLGTMDFGATSGGVAGHQWATGSFSEAAQTTSTTWSGQLTNAALLMMNNLGAVTKRASFQSMDANGFTLNYSVAGAGAAQVVSLALKGVNVQAGSFNKTGLVPTFVQQNATKGAGVNSVTNTLPGASTTGNLIVATVGFDSAAATVSSITDTNGNVYTLAAGPTIWGSNYHAATYYASNIIGGATPLTITARLSAASTSFFELYALEYKGVSTITPLDQVSTGFGTGTAMNSGSKTTTQGNELIYGYGAGASATVTVGGTFITRSTFDSNFAVDETVAAAASYSVTGTNPPADAWVAQMVTFQGGQSITGVGFQPSAVFLHSFQDVANASPENQFRFGFGASDGVTSASSALEDLSGVTTTNVEGIDKTTKAFMKVDNSTPAVDAEADLASMDADGFTLNWTTNDAAATQVLYLAIAPLAVTQVKLIGFTATTYARGALLQWQTGYEFNNLGFNLYREVQGVRTKVNASLIAGSGLVAGRGAAVNAMEAYARWDLDPAATSGAVVYWLEDLDFSGKATLHGPITPAAGALNAPVPTVTLSGNLNDLGKGTTRQHQTVVISTQPAAPGAGALARSGPLSSQTDQPLSPLATQWTLAAQPLVKIGIQSPGWYWVSQADLVAAGLSTGVDSRTLRLFLGGIEQAILVLGNPDGTFGPGDGIEFYGAGVDTPYTDTQVYFLASGGGGQGLRMGVETGAGSPAPPASFWSTVQRKDRSVYFASLVNSNDQNWFGALVSTAATDLTLTSDHLDPAAPGLPLLTVTLQGVGIAGHQVGVSVNGTSVGEMDFQGQIDFTQTFSVPAGVLLDGAVVAGATNDITLTVLSSDPMDVSLVDVLQLSYWHTYVADADLLFFTVPAGAGPVTVGGFASPAIQIADITTPAASSTLLPVGPPVQAAGDGSWSVTGQGSSDGPRTLIAFSDLTIGTPAFVEANHPSTWHALTRTQDYVVISHGDFIAQVYPLAALREQQGHRAAVIDVQDLYDEFSFGEKTPQALKDFLQWAQAHWQAPPHFVVLVGDATIDPRNYSGLGDDDFVPTAQVAMTEVALMTASDDWFVDFNGDGLPQIPIGRLSVRTADSAAAVVAKIVSYDQGAPQPWTKNVLLVADQNDLESNFEQFTANLSAEVPAGYTANHVLRGTLGDPAAHQAIIDGVNAGQLIVNYSGHGSVQLWGSSGELLESPFGCSPGVACAQPINDVTASWLNPTQLPFVVAMNCLNGLFDQIYDEQSLAEALQRAPAGGAVAVWASSSTTSSATQALVNQELFRLLFQGTYATIGEAVAAAKAVVSNPDLRRSWIFFGDPAMHLSGTPQPSGQPTVPVPTPNTLGPPPPRAAVPPTPGTPTTPGDFDGDGKADLTVFRPSSGLWYILQSSTHDTTSLALAWGLSTDIPVPGDYDGDGKTDPAVFRPSTGMFYILESSTNYTTSMALAWGASTDIPVPADFDGDGKIDPAVYRPSTGQWLILTSSSHYLASLVVSWGLSTDVPLPGDYDGDGQADPAVYRPSTGQWLILESSTHYTTHLAASWGLSTDIPVPGDYDGDGLTDPAVYRPSTGQWLFLKSSTSYGSSGAASWGVSTDTPVPGYYDGPGPIDPAVYRPSTGQWFILQSSTNYTTGYAVTWGLGTDTPINRRP